VCEQDPTIDTCQTESKYVSVSVDDQLSLEEEAGPCMSEAFFWKTAEPVYRERLSLIYYTVLDPAVG